MRRGWNAEGFSSKTLPSMQDRGKNDSSYSAMVKYYCSEMALGVVSRAMQIHGAYGYVKEFPVERHYRDIKLCTIFEGSSEILRSIIAKNKLQSERDNIQ